MSFDWIEYLNLARKLSGKPLQSVAPEAEERAAISRAYYAAFCKARNHLRNNEGYVKISSSGGSHDFVISRFSLKLGQSTENKKGLRTGISIDLGR